MVLRPRKLLPLFLVLLFAGVAGLPAQSPVPPVFNVRDYGAVGDGVTLDTAAIRRAVEDCARRGGGTILLPPGTYLSSTIDLGSNMTLHLGAGAILRGDPDLRNYRLVGDEEGWDIRALIMAEHAENVAVTGEGRIDGNHVYNAELFARQPKIRHPDLLPGWIGGEWNRGPHAIAFHFCRHVLVRDVLIEESANYAVRVRDSSEITVDRIRTRGGWDGINVVRCRFITITNCHIESGDDAIAAWVDENMVVSNCILNSATSGMRITNGIRHFTATNCVIYGPGKYPQRAGRKHGTEHGIVMHAYSAPPPGEKEWLGVPIEDVKFSNISITGVRSPFRIGILDRNQPIHDVTFENITVTGAVLPALVEGGPNDLAGRIALRNIRLTNTGGATGPTRLGEASVLVCQNIADLTLENVVLDTAADDARPALIARNIRRLRAPGLEIPRRVAGVAPAWFSDIGRLVAFDSPDIVPVAPPARPPAPPAPATGPVQPPFRVAGSTATPGCRQVGTENRFVITPVIERGRFGDEHDTIFQRAALPPEAVATVNVTSVTGDHWSARAGLLVSNDAADPAAAGYLVLTVTPGYGCALQWDEDGDGVLDQHTPFEGHTELPTELKLVRAGDRFTGYCRLPGRDWIEVGSATVASARPQLDVGMFACLRPAAFADFTLSTR